MQNKAIFLDRDGVINDKRTDYVKSVNEFIIHDDVADAIKIIKKHNFLAIVITNQSVIGRKTITVKTLTEIHNKLQNYLNQNNTRIDKIYFCSHKPEDNCYCRKPKPGLLLQAAKDFDIDLKNSWMIGDSLTDIEAATSVGCKTILMKKNQILVNIVKTLFDKNFI